MITHKQLIGGVLFLSFLACKETSDTRTQNEAQSLTNAGRDDNDEKVDQPSNIAGSYLYCQPLLDQSAGEVVYKAGCRITDAQSGTKVDLSRAAQKTEWSFRAAAQSNITADIAIGQPQDTYHAVYTFKLPPGQAPNLGDGSGAVVASLTVAGRTDPVIFTSSLDALVIEVIDSRMLDVFQPLIP